MGLSALSPGDATVDHIWVTKRLANQSSSFKVITQPAPFDLSADRAGYAPRSLSGVKRSRRSAALSLSKAEGRSGC